MWQWDPSGGSISFAEQMSEQSGFDDKWNTRYNLTLGDKTYPSKARPIDNPASGYWPCQYDQGPLFAESGEPAPQTLEVGFERVVSDGGASLVLIPDLNGGVARYAARARALATSLLSTGPARGVVTFAQPLSRRALDQLISAGMTVHTIEAVSAELAPGVRLTYGNAFGPHAWDQMADAAAEEGTAMLGVVAAEVTVLTVSAYAQLANSDVVALIDMSPEQVRRETQGTVKVHLNDQYWQLAGWIDDK